MQTRKLSSPLSFPISIPYAPFAYLCMLHILPCGPGSSVGIATELRAGRSGIESRWGWDFSPVQTGPEAHPAFCKMDTGSFPGLKCGRGLLLTTHPLLVPRSWKSRAVPLSTLWATPSLLRENFTYTAQLSFLNLNTSVGLLQIIEPLISPVSPRLTRFMSSACFMEIDAGVHWRRSKVLLLLLLFADGNASANFKVIKQLSVISTPMHPKRS